MQRRIHKSDEEVLRKAYPLAGLLDGWFFRQRETSAGVRLVEGSDLRGRRVARRGTDPEELLQTCVREARELSG